MTATYSSRRRGDGMLCGISLAAVAFGDVLEGARKRRDLDSHTLAARAGITLVDLYLLEHGRAEPKLGLLLRLAAALGVSPAWIVEEVFRWMEPHDDGFMEDL